MMKSTLSPSSNHMKMLLSARRQKWISQFEPRPQAKIKLFCIPYAGGSSQTYSKWHHYMNDDIEINAIQLAGRDGRKNEAFSTCIHEISEEICQVLSTVEEDVALFGHSMGALIAYEVANKMELRNKGLSHLFLSARPSPDIPQRFKRSHLPRNQLIAHLQSLGGTNNRILMDEGLMDLAIPVIRADYALLESYIINNKARVLNTPSTLFSAQNDHLVPLDQVHNWKRYLPENTQLHEVSGDHFYLNSHPQELFSYIENKLINSNLL